MALGSGGGSERCFGVWRGPRCSAGGRKERRSMAGGCWGCSRPLLLPASLILRALVVSRAEDAESRCKRQRHDLHVRLNSPECQLSPRASWKWSRGLNPLQFYLGCPTCAALRLRGQARLPRPEAAGGWGFGDVTFPQDRLGEREMGKLQNHIALGMAAHVTPTPKRG